MPESLDFIKTITRKETKLVQNLILPRLAHIFVHLEIPLSLAQKLAVKTIHISSSDKPIEKIELELYTMLAKNGTFRVFDDKMTGMAGGGK